MKHYKIIRLHPRLYHHLKRLFKRAFGVRVSMKQIERKYDTTLCGARDIGYLAMDGTTPAAFYGVLPERTTINNAQHMIAQSADTMTDPDHRGQGLFLMLAQFTYALAKEHGFSYVYGFPNENSLPGFAKHLDWHWYGHMWKFTIPTGCRPVSAAAHKIGGPVWAAYLACVRSTLYDYNISVLDLAGTDTLKVYHKMHNPDVFLIRFNNAPMLVKVGATLHVGYISTINVETLAALGRMLRCHQVALYVSKNHRTFEHLAHYLDPVQSLPIGFYQISESIEYDKLAFTGGDFDTF